MIAKKERHETELAVHTLRTDAGVQAIRTWLYMRRDEINTAWPHATGPELFQMQGEAQHVARLIRLIEAGPSIKVAQGG